MTPFFCFVVLVLILIAASFPYKTLFVVKGLAIEVNWADGFTGNCFYVYSHLNANIFFGSGPSV